MLAYKKAQLSCSILFALDDCHFRDVRIRMMRYSSVDQLQEKKFVALLPMKFFQTTEVSAVLQLPGTKKAF